MLFRICGIGATPNQRSARKLLQVVLAAGRALKWSEAETAIATIDEARYGPGVLSLCFPILEVKGSGDKIVGFIHSSAREFFRFHDSFMEEKTLEHNPVLDDELSVQSSGISSIFSGGASFDSQSSADEMLSAMDETVYLLANDEVLKPLYHAAIENEAIGGAYFGKRFRHLLELCSEDLKREAHENLQLYLVKLLRSRAAYFSNRLRAMHDPVYGNMAIEMRKLDVQRNERSRPEVLEQYLRERANPAPLRPEPQQVAEIRQNDVLAEAEQDDAASQSIDEESEPDRDQMDQPNLSNLKQFFLSSSAFANLRTNFQRFVQHYETGRTSPEIIQTPYPTQHSVTNLVYVKGDQATGTLSHKQLTKLEVLETSMLLMFADLRSFLSDCASAISNKYDQYFELAVDRDKVRIRWECPCGRMLWDDFRELRPGAAEDLRESLNSYKKTMRAQEACDLQQIPSSCTIGTHAGSVSTTIVSSNTETSSQFSNTTAATDGAVLNGSLSLKLQNDPKFLLLCFRKPRDTLRLYQLRVDDITTDFQLFRLLRDTYRAYQGLSGRLLKPRKIRSVVFRKVS